MEIHPIEDPYALHYYALAVEILASGNDVGDDDNWRFVISGNNLLTQVRISGAWVTTHTRERPV